MKPIKSHYFPHDWDARQDEKIVDLYGKYDWEGYGLYWAILEVMAQNDGHCLTLAGVGGLAKVLNRDKDQFEQFIKDCIDPFKLFESDGTSYWSNSLRIRIARAFDKAERCSVAGKKGAAKRYGKDGEEELFEEGGTAAPPPDYAKIVAEWNAMAKETGLTFVRTLTDARKQAIRKRLTEKTFDLPRIYAEIRASDFLRGVGKEWRVDFDFVFTSPGNYVKILEGRYRNRPGAQTGRGAAPEMPTRKYVDLSKEH